MLTQSVKLSKLGNLKSYTIHFINGEFILISILSKIQYIYIFILFVYSYRWGIAAHIVFLVFCFMTNIIVTAMLLLGGSAVVNALTGVNIYAASFLIPLGVIVYTLAGGLKATFLASYIHSVIGTLYPISAWFIAWTA